MVIGIGGCSQSGKSTLAEQLYEKLMEWEIGVVVLNIDDFVKPTQGIPWIRFHVDWEIPESIDFEKYDTAIEQAKLEYEVVICDGFLVYNQAIIYQHFDKSIFIGISKNVFVKRKKKDLRWGKEPDWYIEHIWNTHLKYGQIEHINDVRVLNGIKAIDVIEVLEWIGV